MRQPLVIVGRLGLAVVFLWAGVAKLRDPWMVFAMQMDAMHIFPEASITFLARTMPWVEVILGFLLVAGIKMRYVAPVATFMLAVFFTVVTILYFRGFQGDCGCFGPGEQLGPKTIARDGALVILAIWVTWQVFRPPTGRRLLQYK